MKKMRGTNKNEKKGETKERGKNEGKVNKGMKCNKRK
jgi:hypothetical protein